MREIQYKKYSNIDGPRYFVTISKVNRIVYPSGDEDVFNRLEPKLIFDGQQERGILVLVTGDSIPIQLLELDHNKIRYKKLTQIEGPVYVRSLKKVHELRYSSGEVRTYNPIRLGRRPIENPAKPFSYKITPNWDVYYFNGDRISPQKVISKLEALNDPKINLYVKQIKKLRRSRRVLGYSSVAVGATALTLSYIGVLVRIMERENRILTLAGWGGASTFVTWLAYSGLKPVYHDRLRQAVILYNQKVEQ